MMKNTSEIGTLNKKSLEKLSQLAALKNNGAITEDEFAQEKAKIIKNQQLSKSILAIIILAITGWVVYNAIFKSETNQSKDAQVATPEVQINNATNTSITDFQTGYNNAIPSDKLFKPFKITEFMPKSVATNISEYKAVRVFYNGDIVSGIVARVNEKTNKIIDIEDSIIFEHPKQSTDEYLNTKTLFTAIDYTATMEGMGIKNSKDVISALFNIVNAKELKDTATLEVNDGLECNLSVMYFPTSQEFILKISRK